MGVAPMLVSARPIPSDMLPWAMACLGHQASDGNIAFEAVAGDASSRRYFRLRIAALSYIVLEAPPATEKNEAFLRVRRLLEIHEIRVPALLGVDLARGYLLLEDLGDQMLLPKLNLRSVEHHYQAALELLVQIAQFPLPSSDLAPYDKALLGEELQRFPQWFVAELLQIAPGEGSRQLFNEFSSLLIDSALAQPTVFVHRDFHSRNLMLLPGDEMAVIDFQDAVAGPVTYDLVSLLRDCYISWPETMVRSWALAHRDKLLNAGLITAVDDEEFMRWFDWMGLQRHIKVLGTFARLSLRDGKPGYLADLPLVIHYIDRVLEKYASAYPVMAEFRDWFQENLVPVIKQQSWSRVP